MSEPAPHSNIEIDDYIHAYIFDCDLSDVHIKEEKEQYPNTQSNKKHHVSKRQTEGHHHNIDTVFQFASLPSIQQDNNVTYCQEKNITIKEKRLRQPLYEEDEVLSPRLPAQEYEPEQDHEQIVKRPQNDLVLHSQLDDPIQYMSQFPREIFSAVNCGDFRSINHLIGTTLHDKCVIRWNEPDCYIERVGKEYMMNYYEVMLDALPDSVICLKSVKMRNSQKNDLVLLRCRFHFQGTMLRPTNFDKLYGRRIPTTSLVQHMDISDKTMNEIAVLEDVSEIILSQRGFLPWHMTGETKVDYYYDPVLRKIVGYCHRFKLQSFTTVDPMKMLSYSNSYDSDGLRS